MAFFQKLAMVEDICSHVLVLNAGRRKFFGTLEQLRIQYADGDLQNARTLEEAFFSALSEVEDELITELAGGTRKIESTASLSDRTMNDTRT